MQKLHLSEFLNENLPPVEALGTIFQSAKPFCYAVIDDFLSKPIAQRLLDEFPSFDEARAKTEHGTVGNKATRPDLKDISPFYAAIDSLIASKEFLDYMSVLSGIPDLVYDPLYFGGGTHESRDTQELDVHIDFNYDAATGLYRRLNLLIYLNPEWETEWGGNIEIHSDPRNPDVNEVFSFTPIFNRCMLFETHEHSWHGFDQIHLPADKKHLTRKSLSVYFYSKQRPTAEEVPPHTTFYVQRPLPGHIKPGTTLSADDYTTIRGLIRKRDHWIHYYQNKEMEYNKAQIQLQDAYNLACSNIRLPVHGYITQLDCPQGYWHDGWAGEEITFRIKTDRYLRGISIGCYRPEYFPVSGVNVKVNDVLVGQGMLFSGETNDVTFSLESNVGEEHTITITTDVSYNLMKNGKGADNRDLSFLLLKVTGIH